MEAVSFEDFDEINEISVRNIKKACMKHYGMSETMFCDALAGEHTSKSVISNSMQVCPAEPVGCWHAKIGKAHYRYHNLRWDLHFDMSVMARTGRPTTVDFSIEPEPFGTGGFRKAFKATWWQRIQWLNMGGEEVSRKGCGRHHCFTSEGTFRKYINNNGSICESVNADSLIKKAVSGKLLI